jgi:glycosyltransferase involved in cell wall biosynthesis
MSSAAAREVELSVVMPMFNEEAVIGGVVGDVRRFVLEAVPTAELIVIDDCSTDDTAKVVAEIAGLDSRIRLLRNPGNVGHGPSLRRGLDAATGDWLLLLDSDGQLDIADFADMWERRNVADLVIGRRVERHDPRHRLVLTWFVRLVASLTARTWIVDSNAPFKLVRRSLYEHLRSGIPADTFAPSMLLAIGGYRCGARVAVVPVSHCARASGSSSLHPARLVRAVTAATVQTMRYAATRVEPYRCGS